MPPDIGVRDETPTISRFISVAATVTDTRVTVTVPVPLSILVSVDIFMPPGVNWRIGVGIGFNGKKFIPTDAPNEYVQGSGIKHSFLAGWQVQTGIDVFLDCHNRLDHQIFVAFHLDRRPVQKTANSGLVLPQ